jgi:hypothetical protein
VQKHSLFYYISPWEYPNICRIFAIISAWLRIYRVCGRTGVLAEEAPMNAEQGRLEEAWDGTVL